LASDLLSFYSHQVLPYVISRLQGAGYRLVTVAECLGVSSPYQRAGPAGTPDVSIDSLGSRLSIDHPSRRVGPADSTRDVYSSFTLFLHQLQSWTESSYLAAAFHVNKCRYLQDSTRPICFPLEPKRLNCLACFRSCQLTSTRLSLVRVKCTNRYPCGVTRLPTILSEFYTWQNDSWRF
jgi:hypothetical protein